MKDGNRTGKDTANTSTTGGGQEQQTDSRNTGVETGQGVVLGETSQEVRDETKESQTNGETKGESSWSFSTIWNSSLEQPSERPVEKRERLYASELGKPMIDVYLKLHGETPTNPPNPRSLRKFEAGNVWEWIVELILIRAGIMQAHQDRITYQYSGLLEVSGKLDFIAGGKPDWEKVDKEISDMPLPEAFIRASKNIVKTFAEKYPNGLASKILEVKSVSAFMFEALENRKNASLKIHRLQTYHYLKSLNMNEGAIVYICRDDCRMMEVPVFLNSSVEDEYRGYIEEITGYYNRNELPPLEKPIVWDEDMNKFSKNNMIAWSPFLTKLYGLKDQAEFDEKYQSTSARWNRVMNRKKKGDTMTKNNEEALKEIETAGFDVESLLAKMPEKVTEETDGDIS